MNFLAELFEVVFVPKAVQDELTRPETPLSVRNWISTPQNWLQIRIVEGSVPIGGLHRGESEAIQLALQLHADAVLLDDLDGREATRQSGLVIIGTVGLLERAADLPVTN